MTTNSIARSPHPAQPDASEPLTSPTNLPAGDRRPALVLLPTPRPTTVPAVLLAAARIIETNGWWPTDWVEDAFDRRLTTPHASRRMNIVGAIRCAVSGDPHRESQLADTAIGYVALSLDPEWTDAYSLRAHVDDWAQEPGRTAANAVALLEHLATAPERAA
ncbi:hypothetical protein [Streptomyces sp. NPDC057854]|uniref:DUF6197 family protein n=1 Tax=unclassified Streptomyces TaxID=2593676 RepID=UPI0036C0A592